MELEKVSDAKPEESGTEKEESLLWPRYYR